MRYCGLRQKLTSSKEAEQELRQRIPLRHPSEVDDDILSGTQPLLRVPEPSSTSPVGQVVGDESPETVEFWDEFFDSLILTVPFTFLFLLLDM